MCVSCACCLLSGRGLCNGAILRPEESCSVLCVSVCVIQKHQERGGHGPHWAVAPERKRRKDRAWGGVVVKALRC